MYFRPFFTIECHPSSVPISLQRTLGRQYHPRWITYRYLPTASLKDRTWCLITCSSSWHEPSSCIQVILSSLLHTCLLVAHIRQGYTARIQRTTQSWNQQQLLVPIRRGSQVQVCGVKKLCSVIEMPTLYSLVVQSDCIPPSWMLACHVGKKQLHCMQGVDWCKW